jgi:ligand-binding SRPBCC domain-containing protein
LPGFAFLAALRENFAMPIIKIEIEINAPIERVFDLARCIDLHEETMSKTGEKAIEGVTKGLINLGETVTWQATHFGISQKLTSKITVCDRPFHFQDVMIKGAFKRFTHDHFFALNGEKVLMKDIFDYNSPLWILGKIADALVLKSYMKNLLTERNLTAFSTS